MRVLFVQLHGVHVQVVQRDRRDAQPNQCTGGSHVAGLMGMVDCAALKIPVSMVIVLLIAFVTSQCAWST